LQVNTINGAYNSHEEGIKGSITPGKLADFVVLADDPHTVSKDKIKDIEIVQTGHRRLDGLSEMNLPIPSAVARNHFQADNHL
jgi:adenine deaminase